MSELNKIDTEYGITHGTLASYITGFVSSLFLTLVPYYIVVNHLILGPRLVGVIVSFGVVQLFVQMVFFLHLSPKAKAKWNIISLVFTLIMVLALVIGSIWIMANLSYNMDKAMIDKNSNPQTAF